jgi:proliferating cell nuclear antigen
MSENYENYCFYLKSVQSSVFRTLVDAVKEIVADTNIMFDKSGITIKTVDESYNAMIHLKLNGNKFEEYSCSGTYTIGVALLNLHKLFKTMSSTDVLTMYQLKSEPTRLVLKIENNKKAKLSKYKLHLLDLPKKTIKSFSPSFNQAITIDSSEFHKIVREMKDIATDLELRCYDNTLRFKSVKGLFADAEIYLSLTDIQQDKKNTKNDIVQGVFDLKYLSMFCKCTPLSKKVCIYLKNDYPLIIRYNVNNLGEIRLILMMSQTDDD